MSGVAIARRLLSLAAIDGDIYPGRIGYWARAAHRNGLAVDEIAETCGTTVEDVEEMLREDQK